MIPSIPSPAFAGSSREADRRKVRVMRAARTTLTLTLSHFMGEGTPS
jgi:hypothetical protein